MMKKCIVPILFLLVATAFVAHAQTFPEAGGMSDSKTLENLLDNTSASKQAQQLEIPKETESLFSDSYVDPKTYHLGPYDILLFSIWQPINQVLTLNVSPEGTLVIPRVGEFDVKNKTLDSARTEILAALKKHISNNVQASLSLYKPRNVVEYIMGAVKQPGSYIVAANERAGFAVQMANTLSKEAATMQNPLEEQKDLMKKEKEQDQISLFGSQGDVDYSLRNIIVRHN